MLVRVLPPQLHYGIGTSIDTLQKLMQKLEIRACRQPDLKLAPPDISSGKLDEMWKNPTQNSTINAVSTVTTAPPTAAAATASADPATVNVNPPPQQTVAATAASNTKPKEENNDQQSRARDNSYRSKKKDKKKPQRGQHQQQQQRGRGNNNRYGACHTCGRSSHRRQECYYSGFSCHNFGRPGHLASVCRQPKKKRQHSPAPAWPAPLLPNRCDSHSRCSSVFPKCEPWQLKCRDDISWTSTTTTPTTGNHLLPGLDTPIANPHQASSPAAITAATAAAAAAGDNITTVNSIDSKSYSFSLKITIGICDKWLEALVDMGSTVSLIEEDIVTGNDVKINNHITLKTAGKGDGLFSNSKVNQQFVIGNKIFEHEFLVVKSLYLSPISLILGYDLISKFKFVIKAQENTQIFVDDLVIPTIASNSYTVNIIASERERQTFLINNTEINVPANSAYCVSLNRVGREMQNGTKVAVIPTQEFSGVLNSDTLAEVCDGFITILIYNLASQPITYKINSTFARCEPVTLTERIAALSVCADHDQRVQHLVAALTPPECLPFMRDIAATYASAFVVEDSEPTGFTEVMPFSIVTSEARPMKLRPYRVPVCQQDEVSQQLARMEEQGVISLSKSPWASPMVVVKKKDGSLRLCMDYRKLNSLTIGDSFPLPSIEELLINLLSVTPGVRGRFRTVTTSGRLGRFSSITFFSFFFFSGHYTDDSFYAIICFFFSSF